MSASLLELADRITRLEATVYSSNVPAVANLTVHPPRNTIFGTDVTVSWVSPEEADVSHYEIYIYDSSRMTEPQMATAVQDSPAHLLFVEEVDRDYTIYVVTVLRNGARMQVWEAPSVTAAVTKAAIPDENLTGISASKIGGLIQANQIAAINASQITGQIQASQIESINASQIGGLIQASQIASITASQITGQIQANQIASIQAAQITGLIRAEQIESIEAGQISTLIVNSQIESLDFSKVTNVVVGGGAQDYLLIKNNSFAEIGRLGMLGPGAYGAWFKEVWVGGSGTNDAPFKTDSSGRLTIDATDTYGGTAPLLRLTKSGIVVEILPTQLGQFTYGLRMDRPSTSSRCRLSPNSIIFGNTNDQIYSSVYYSGGEARVSVVGFNGSQAYLIGDSNLARFVAIDAANNYVRILPTEIKLFGWGADRFVVDSYGHTNAASVNSQIAYKINGTTIIDSNRIADFTALRINGTTVFGSDAILDSAGIKVSGTQIINSSREVVKGNLRVVPRILYGSIRPTRSDLTDGELAFWWNNSEGKMEILYRDGTNVFYYQSDGVS